MMVMTGLWKIELGDRVTTSCIRAKDRSARFNAQADCLSSVDGVTEQKYQKAEMVDDLPG
jgi:hypothetical protein